MVEGRREAWWARPGGYAADEPLVVPFWLVLTAAHLARARKLTRDSQAEDTRIQGRVASAAQAGAPRGWPHGAYPAPCGDGQQLAQYWQEVAGELPQRLPDPSAHRRSPGGGGG